MPPEEGSIEEEAAGEELGQEEYAAEDGGAAEWDEGAANDGAGDICDAWGLCMSIGIICCLYVIVYDLREL